MITDRLYNTITKTVKNVVDELEKHNISHEVLGDEFTFTLAPSATILTEHCTIEIWKDEVKVNEKQVDSLEDVIKIIKEFE